MAENNGIPFSIAWANETLTTAKKFSENMHAFTNQTYGPLPYTFHLQHVENVVQRFFKSDKPHTWYPRIAAHLHDIVEDTNTSIDVIESMFGKNVSDLVWAVTDEPLTQEELNSGLKNNRKNRKAKTYKKLKHSEFGVALKLADRIANIENCHSWESGMLDMYKKEYTEFFTQLWNADHSDKIQRMWKYLYILVRA